MQREKDVVRLNVATVEERKKELKKFFVKVFLFKNKMNYFAYLPFAAKEEI